MTTMNPLHIATAPTGYIVATTAAGSLARQHELAALIRSMITDAPDSRTSSDVTGVLTNLLIDALRAEARRLPPAGQTGTERSDAVWNTVYASHIHGESWSMSAKDTLATTGSSKMTLTAMRKAARDLKAAGIHPSGSWAEDRETARMAVLTD